MVFGANMVNALRFAFNRTSIDRGNPSRSSTRTTLGIERLQLQPGRDGARRHRRLQHLGRHRDHAASSTTNAYQVSRRPDAGARQPSARRSAPTSRTGRSTSLTARALGRQLDVQRPATGLGLADFLHRPRRQPRARRARRAADEQWYLGLYAQDTWRASEPRHAQRRPALGAVLRPERRERRHLQLQHRQLPAATSRARCSSTRRPG